MIVSTFAVSCTLRPGHLLLAASFTEGSELRKSKPKTKHPGGRPSKYSAEFHPKIVYALARNGDTEQEIADLLDVSTSTLTLWKKEHPEFSSSLNKGRADVDANVENALLKRALGFREPAVKIFMPAGASKPVYADYQEYYPPDVAAAFIWLKNRKPGSWRDRREITGNDGGPLAVQIIDDVPASKT